MKKQQGKPARKNAEERRSRYSDQKLDIHQIAGIELIRRQYVPLYLSEGDIRYKRNTLEQLFRAEAGRESSGEQYSSRTIAT